MDKERLQLLKDTIKTLKGSITKEEFSVAFKTLTEFVKGIKEWNITELKKAKEMIASAVSEMKSEFSSHSSSMSSEMKTAEKEMMSYCMAEMKKMEKEQANTMNFMRDKARQLHDGRDGDDADETKIVAEVLSKIPKVEVKDLTLEVEALQKENEEQQKEIDELKKRPIGTGGGVTNLRIQQAFKYILKTEEPVGDIDGVNLTYRLSQPIFAILSMSINGETIAQLPNYTIAGNTFTFTTALPAVYANKDWEVKYI